MSRAVAKKALDVMVAEACGVDQKRVAQVTNALYDLLSDQLATVGSVTIPYIGTLTVRASKLKEPKTLCHSDFHGARKWRTVKVREQIRVSFRKAEKLSNYLKERRHG